MIQYYQSPHNTQLGYPNSAITRSSGCTWTAASNGVANATGGKQSPTPDQVHALVKNSEETTPRTPGWSLPDTDKAMARLKPPVGFEVRTGDGWIGVEAALDAGYSVLLQGDSDQFPDAEGTCSSKFNGDHAILAHPQRDAQGRQLIYDGICPKARYETRATLRRYAEELYAKVFFGVFTAKVPSTEDDMTLFFKPDAPSLTGTAIMDGPGHSIAAFDGRLFGSRAAGEAYTVVASGRLHDITGKPIGIDSKQPPGTGRDVVFIIDRPEWGNSCYAIKADVKFTPDQPGGEVVPPNELTCKPFIDAAVQDVLDNAVVGIIYKEG